MYIASNLNTYIIRISVYINTLVFNYLNFNTYIDSNLMHVNECQHHLSKYKFIHTSNQSFIQVNYLHENMCWQGKSGLCSNKLTIDTDDLCALCLFYGKKNNTTNHLVVNSRCLVYMYFFLLLLLMI